MSTRRSASVGALPQEKKHFVSRNESSSGMSLDVRCACQYFQSDSLLPERINPVDSRPTSKQGFHSEIGVGLDATMAGVADALQQQQQLQQHQYLNMAAITQHDDLSTHSFGGHGMASMEFDRLSMRSMGAIATPPPPVDLSFVEKYPELEETARARGLVVRSISDATDGDPIGGGGGIGGSSTFLAGHRRRQLSVGGLSSGSGHQRDPETLSMRSGTSLRRISNSNSKVDLYIADINIPNARDCRREQRSVSMSRRTSSADLYHAPIMPAQAALSPPQLNLIAPTPSPAVADIAPDFQRAFTPLRQRQPSPTPSGAPDYRNAKPPLSVDYMRPNENKENLPYHQTYGTLPQHRSIDVSKYGGETTVAQSLPYETDYKQLLSSGETDQPGPHQPVVSAVGSLQQAVAELEMAATYNIVDIRDNIQTERTRPPSLGGDLSHIPLHVAEQTKINITSAIPVVDVNAFVQSEEEKAALSQNKPKPAPRHKSPPARRPKSPTAMDILHLPSSRPSSPITTDTTMETLLKRQHTPEHQLSPERTKKLATDTAALLQPIDFQPVTINGAIALQEASPEVKTTYTARFKSMFTSKGQDATPGTPTRQKSPSPVPLRQKSPSPLRDKSPTPHREKSPSPAPGKLLSIFSKPKPIPMEIVSRSNAVITKKPDAEPMSVKVTETFSLKVDDMDQYCSRPTKPAAPPPHALTMYSSREDFAASERASVDISEAFAPVIVSAVPHGSFMAGNRNLYSSEIDMPTVRGSESDFRGVSREPSTGSRQLISVPIDITGSGSQVIPRGLPGTIIGAPVGQGGKARAPSEQRRMLRKSSFREGRTQSHDRARAGGSHENLYAPARMTKTVSFNFDERKSRLGEFESKTPLTEKQQEHRDFLERTYFSRDHEYEPVGAPPAGAQPSTTRKDASPAPAAISTSQNGATKLSTENEIQRDEMAEARGLQQDLEARYFNAATTEAQTSQMDASMLEEQPTQPESRKKGFMATAQDRTRRMQAGIKSQAGKLKTKLRAPPRKSPSSSPKAKERKRFKAPEFSKIKMPEIKRPDMSKLREIKRPEFTKFNKPDMSKFKFAEKFPTLKLKRSKSFKENETSPEDDETAVTSEDAAAATEAQQLPPPAQKKKFEFKFGTYPRAFRKNKKPVEAAVESSLGTEGPSVIPSTETQPSMESSSSPQGDRGPGPVRSRWADKFSDVSYNDSEGSRYRRYGSEMESFDRESSLERRMKDDLDDTGSEAQDMGILGGVADSKQFAEFDEENRAIHEISNLRSGEFKRRPMVHQDSDLRSEDSKDAVGWTDKEIQKNKLLRKAELEAEASYYKYHPEDNLTQDALSTASSGKKVVMEEIDDDEFFLRKRGISQDNMELRQYISEAIREGYDMPINALQHVGETSGEPMKYGDFDVPPPKPRRLHKHYRPEYGDSQEFQRSDYGDDLSMSQNGSDFMMSGAPKRPMRKGGSRSKYSMDSQDLPLPEDGGSQIQYFDDDEEYLRPPARSKEGMNDLDFGRTDVATKQAYPTAQYEEENDTRPQQQPQPQPPRRQKRRLRDDESIEKDSFINGFGGRSVSNSFLQPPEDVIVYRTEHEYHHIPLATPENYTDGASASSRKSRSASRYDEDDRTSRGAESLALDAHTKAEFDTAIMDDAREEKFIIDMMESDGYAIVRKEQIPKPTPPARRKKFSRSPGERFATLPNIRATRNSPPPERPPPPQSYTPSLDYPLPARRKSATSLETTQNYEDDYEEPEALERPESPRNLQSGEIINKMKFRPLPPPPRPPREKRQRTGLSENKSERRAELEQYRYEDSERIATSSTADSYDQNALEFEVEVSTQTDPLPDDFVCEELEITEDMKIIEPRRTTGGRTLGDLLNTVRQDSEQDRERQLTEDEQLTRGLERFREANRRSLSERSRGSSLSRPQTPSSAVVIERRIATPTPSPNPQEMLVEAAIIVRPIDEKDLEDEDLRREEEELRREGLLTDSSQQSKSDIEPMTEGEEVDENESKKALSDIAASSVELDAAVEMLQQAQVESDFETKQYDEEVARTLRDSEYEEETENAEKYSDHYDEDDETDAVRAQPGNRSAIDLELQLETQLEQALEKELQEEMEKELRELMEEELKDEMEKELREEMEKDLLKQSPQSDSTEHLEIASLSQATTSEVLSDEEKPTSETKSDVDIYLEKDHIKATHTIELQSVPATSIDVPLTEPSKEVEYVEDEPNEPPQPPPRRKSTTLLETPTTLTIAEAAPKDLATVQSVVPSTTPTAPPLLPCRLDDLEVERLRVHALQAGQIVVSQLHGTRISGDELECKSGNLVVQNIELPPGFIEDIVERVRDHRAPLLTAETQTSRQPSSEVITTEERTPSPTTRITAVPPPKPPRQRDLETPKSEQTTIAAAIATTTAATTSTERISNLDEQTQTDATASTVASAQPPAGYPSIEYLQSLAPLAFYNLQRSAEETTPEQDVERKQPHKCRRRHYPRRHEDDEYLESGSEVDEMLEERPISRRSRTRSGTQSPSTIDGGEQAPQTIMQAGRQFISACSLELVNIVNQLTNYVRGGQVDAGTANETQLNRNIPALVLLFFVITFAILIFLLTGRNVHTHHWDYFNPPGHEGRQT